MKQAIEFIPVALFVGVYFTTRDIYLSTALLMVGVLIQVIFEYLRYKKVESRTMVIFWVAMLFGGATLIFRNEQFIQWKPTILNWFFAGALIGTHFIGRENLLQRMLGKQVPLPVAVWSRLNAGWALGFFIAGVLNLVVAYYFSLDVWVTYKLVGGFAITFIYIAITVAYLAKSGYLKAPDEPTE
ncbi:MAG: septation protein IspZ, partial [Gammaproteobacteria bacterium]|nr:septation protein IspZ [Gammaproteobacteria bacterium]